MDDAEKQQPNECDFCYLQRMQTIALNAGMKYRLVHARTGMHRHMKGFNLMVDGKKIVHFKTKPEGCICRT